jgi:hypothetical protein
MITIRPNEFIVNYDDSIIEKVDSLSFDDKIKIWMYYMVAQVFLNTDREIIETTPITMIYFSQKLDYPIFSATLGATQKLPIIDFDTFCSTKRRVIIWDYSKFYTGNDIGNDYTCIYDQYIKYKDKIFN